MDIEQLKLILTTLEKAGDGALTIAILHFLVPYFAGIMMIIGLFILIHGVKALILFSSHMNKPEYPVDVWAKKLGCTSEFGSVFADNRRDAIMRVNMLVDEHVRPN